MDFDVDINLLVTNWGAAVLRCFLLVVVTPLLESSARSLNQAMCTTSQRTPQYTSRSTRFMGCVYGLDIWLIIKSCQSRVQIMVLVAFVDWLLWYCVSGPQCETQTKVSDCNVIVHVNNQLFCSCTPFLFECHITAKSYQNNPLMYHAMKMSLNGYNIQHCLCSNLLKTKTLKNILKQLMFKNNICVILYFWVFSTCQSNTK